MTACFKNKNETTTFRAMNEKLIYVFQKWESYDIFTKSQHQQRFQYFSDDYDLIYAQRYESFIILLN